MTVGSGRTVGTSAICGSMEQSQRGFQMWRGVECSEEDVYFVVIEVVSKKSPHVH